MQLTAKYSIRGLLGLVTTCAIAVGVFYAPTTFDIRYDTTGWPNRIETQVGNPITVISADAPNRYTEIVTGAPVVDIILNNDNIDTIRIRVNMWQKLALCRANDRIWIDTAFTRGGRIHPSK